MHALAGSRRSPCSVELADSAGVFRGLLRRRFSACRMLETGRNPAKFGGDPGGIRTRDLDLERVASWARLDDGVYTIAVRQRDQGVTIAGSYQDHKLGGASRPAERACGRLGTALRSAGRSRTRRFPEGPGRSLSFSPHW